MCTFKVTVKVECGRMDINDTTITFLEPSEVPTPLVNVIDDDHPTLDISKEFSEVYQLKNNEQVITFIINDDNDFLHLTGRNSLLEVLYIENHSSIKHLLFADSYKLTKVPNILPSNVTDLSSCFADCFDFEQDISTWDVSKVTNMENMFYNCTYFNSPLNNWDMSKVINTSHMFYNCVHFNQPLDKWDMRYVRDISYMFYACINFNQDVSSWNIKRVLFISALFAKCDKFNQPLNNWQFNRHIDSLKNMFLDCESFNQPLNNWDVSNITCMRNMFNGCISFNQNLNDWDVSNVRDMGYMFAGCFTFDQPLDNWKVRKINAEYMFAHCRSYKSKIDWDIGSFTCRLDMITHCDHLNIIRKEKFTCLLTTNTEKV